MWWGGSCWKETWIRLGGPTAGDWDNPGPRSTPTSVSALMLCLHPCLLPGLCINTQVSVSIAVRTQHPTSAHAASEMMGKGKELDFYRRC